MADFKQGDVVCLNSDLEHKFTVHQIISAGPRKGLREVGYWEETTNSFKYPSFSPSELQLAPLQTKDIEQQS